MKTVDTLVSDIHALVGNMKMPDACEFPLPVNMGAAYITQMSARVPKIREDKTLYFSELGDVCTRRLWYKHHTPDAGESITPVTRIKFLYGDMLEELVLQLARDAGHKVEGEQQGVEYVHSASGWRVRGRIDAVIDGVVVDVKSVTKMSERKFHGGLIDDPFGYYGQINGYATVLKNDKAGFLTIQKELGHIHYFPQVVDTSVFAYNMARAVAAVEVDAPKDAPLADVPASATSKNRKLCTTCSYCPYKQSCFPALRGFAYSGKVEYLTKVVDLPRVPEIDLTKVEDET
jgi:hypothetical protein